MDVGWVGTRTQNLTLLGNLKWKEGTKKKQTKVSKTINLKLIIYIYILKNHFIRINRNV